MCAHLLRVSCDRLEAKRIIIGERIARQHDVRRRFVGDHRIITESPFKTIPGGSTHQTPKFEAFLLPVKPLSEKKSERKPIHLVAVFISSSLFNFNFFRPIIQFPSARRRSRFLDGILSTARPTRAVAIECRTRAAMILA